MKKLVFYLLTTLSIRTVSAQVPVDSQILAQTYLINTDTLSGTCFLIEYKGHEYLITARHLFRSNLVDGNSTKIYLYQNESFWEFRATYHVDNDTSLDVAVLVVNESLKKEDTYPIEGKVVLGQDLYFLGYPSFDGNLFMTSDKRGTLPLVKKGILSGMVKFKGRLIYYLDGHNNPGFSGGPVICKDYYSGRNIIIGIISAYYNESKHIKNKKGQTYEEYIQENSGIIKCFSIKFVEDIIVAIK